MVKLSMLLISLFALAGSVNSQTIESKNLQIQVIRFSCSKQLVDSSELDTGLPGAASSPTLENRNKRINVVRVEGNDPKQYQTDVANEGQRVKLPKIITSDKPIGKLSYKYLVEVKNVSANQVVSMKWEYVFDDPTNLQAALLQSFESKKSIKSGSKAKIVIYSNQGHIRTVDAKSARVNQTDQVIIKRIVYADGSVWEG